MGREWARGAVVLVPRWAAIVRKITGFGVQNPRKLCIPLDFGCTR